jgi:small subunit ribosomal protein S16
MLMLRFQRIGRRNDPAFRIVATEKRSKPKSGFLEILGSYHPKTKDTQLKNERILHWLSKGAQASETVHNLLVSKGVIQGKKTAIKMAKSEIREQPQTASGTQTDANSTMEVAQPTTDNPQPTTSVTEEAKEPEAKSEEAAAPAEEKRD